MSGNYTNYFWDHSKFGIYSSVSRKKESLIEIYQTGISHYKLNLPQKSNSPSAINFIVQVLIEIPGEVDTDCS
jgi:hypothetical protein